MLRVRWWHQRQWIQPCSKLKRTPALYLRTPRREEPPPTVSRLVQNRIWWAIGFQSCSWYGIRGIVLQSHCNNSNSSILGSYPSPKTAHYFRKCRRFLLCTCCKRLCLRWNLDGYFSSVICSPICCSLLGSAFLGSTKTMCLLRGRGRLVRRTQIGWIDWIGGGRQIGMPKWTMQWQRWQLGGINRTRYVLPLILLLICYNSSKGMLK